jgi:hypothetical protein
MKYRMASIFIALVMPQPSPAMSTGHGLGRCHCEGVLLPEDLWRECQDVLTGFLSTENMKPNGFGGQVNNGKIICSERPLLKMP